VSIDKWIYWTLKHTTCGHTFEIDITQQVVVSVLVFIVLLASDFQWLMFPFLAILELSLASVASFCTSQLTACSFFFDLD
jgi:hypothetical protein